MVIAKAIAAVTHYPSTYLKTKFQRTKRWCGQDPLIRILRSTYHAVHQPYIQVDSHRVLGSANWSSFFKLAFFVCFFFLKYFLLKKFKSRLNMNGASFLTIMLSNPNVYKVVASEFRLQSHLLILSRISFIINCKFYNKKSCLSLSV